MTTFTTIIRKDATGYKGGVQAKVDGRVIWSEYSPYHAFSKGLAKADAEQLLNNHLETSRIAPIVDKNGFELFEDDLVLSTFGNFKGECRVHKEQETGRLYFYNTRNHRELMASLIFPYDLAFIRHL